MAEPPPASRVQQVNEARDHPPPQAADRGANPDMAKRLHEAVRAAGGNNAVAHRSGVPLSTVNNYVRGRNGMKIEPLTAIAAACNVSLEWLISGAEPVAFLRVVPDFRTAETAPPLGLGEAPAVPSPAATTGGIDLRTLTKAIEIVAAIAGAAEFQDDPKGLARRIATTYAVLIEPEAPRE